MNNNQTFYLCPVCFHATDSRPEEHHHVMIKVQPRMLNDDERRPVTDEAGHLLSRAPAWFLEAKRALSRSSRQATLNAA